ncbi:neutrophil gelatinase-associated lipocalin-like isoform X2 [Notamacropus eugenii]|uniref:neutrophil gelatinase-associated lipocalin-like isoform X2 n=1 Tax=Notamacropus eugenii TaxID=9315 RepID=UPI003B6775C1
MSLSPMWTGMILIGSLRDYLQNSAPALSKIPLQSDFQAKKFQGKWYVIGLAGRNIKTEGLGHNKMYATVYQLQADHSFRVISNLIKGESCDIGFRTFIPKGKRGQFALDNFKAYGVTKYIFRVVKTNYEEFAILYFHSVKESKVNFMASLYDMPSSTDYTHLGSFYQTRLHLCPSSARELEIPGPCSYLFLNMTILVLSHLLPQGLVNLEIPFQRTINADYQEL